MPAFSPLASLRWTPELSEALRRLPADVRLALGLGQILARDPEAAKDPELLQALDEALDGVERLLEPAPWELELDRLDALPAAEREAAVAAAPTGAMDSPELAGACARRSAEALPGNPDDSLAWATLCLQVARRGTSAAHLQWRAHALILTGNAHRARGALAEAGRWFELSTLEERTAPPPPAALAAERAKLRGSWHLEQGDLPAAVGGARRSAVFADLAGERERYGRGVLLASFAYYDAGAFRHAVGASWVATRCYQPVELHPLPALSARFMLAIAWTAHGRHDAARGVMLRAKNLFARFRDRPFVQLLRLWREAKIADAYGESAAADAAYREALAGLLDHKRLSEAVMLLFDFVIALRLRGELDTIRQEVTVALPRLEGLAPGRTTPEIAMRLALLNQLVTDVERVRLGELLRATELPLRSQRTAIAAKIRAPME